MDQKSRASNQSGVSDKELARSTKAFRRGRNLDEKMRLYGYDPDPDMPSSAAAMDREHSRNANQDSGGTERINESNRRYSNELAADRRHDSSHSNKGKPYRSDVRTTDGKRAPPRYDEDGWSDAQHEKVKKKASKKAKKKGKKK